MEVTPAASRRYSLETTVSVVSGVSTGIMALAGYESPVDVVEDVLGGFQRLSENIKNFYRTSGYVFPTAVAVGRQYSHRQNQRNRAALQNFRAVQRNAIADRTGRGSNKSFKRSMWLKRPYRKK